MKLDAEFYRLPLRFDVERLKAEAEAFGENEWRAHPTGFQGNSALLLISAAGGDNDALLGPMRTTPMLERSPYIKQVLASMQTVFGRSRLMRLDGGAEVTEHSDINYHWYSHIRVHVPIVTHPDVRLFCNGKSVHMAPGECWIFDTWKMHKVINPTNQARIHLVADTSGSAQFWDMVSRSERPLEADGGAVAEPRIVPYEPGKDIPVPVETYNAPLVMSPGEVDALVLDIIEDLQAADGMEPLAVARFCEVLNHFRWNWRTNWSLHGPTQAGWAGYQALRKQTRQMLAGISSLLTLASNRSDAVQVFSDRVLTASLNPHLAPLHQPQISGARQGDMASHPYPSGFGAHQRKGGAR